MFITGNFFLFIGSSILLILAPGPDIIFTITQGITNGKRAGVWTAVGLGLGNIVHTLAAAFGITVLLKTSQTAFLIFKILGACYLFYLAFKAIKHRHDIFGMEKSGNSNSGALHLFAKGFIMNVLNPKVALFFLAFLPQFVNNAAGSVPLQIVLYGIIFIVLVIIIFGLFGYFSGSVGQKLLKNEKFSSRMSVMSALVFIGLGLKLAFAQSR
ncbi:MAG TPA: LysE family translocator [Spirochaetota bacterium]|nr:LysE family translocator [Spirochaetota bacterium]